MLKLKRVIFGFLFVFLITTVLGNFVTTKAFASDGCCTVNDQKFCATSSTACTGNTKACDMKDNVIDRDINGDGQKNSSDAYNPSCYIPIVAPESVKITDFGKLFSGAVGFLLLIAFIMAFVYLVLGGLSWITSGGDKAAVETARNKIINALIGLIIVASTWALFQLVGGAIGFNILGGFNLPQLF